MFKFLKDKLKGFFKSAEEKIEEKPLTREERREIEEKEKKEKIREESKEVVETLVKSVEEQKEEEKGVEETEEKPEKREGFFARLQKKFGTVRLSEEKFDELFSSLELLMLENNVAFEVVEKIKKDMKKSLVDIEIKKANLEQELKNSLKKTISEILIEPFDLIEKIENKQGLFVIVFFGINGSGKTTTIAKIASLLKQKGISSVLAASDTFRAASIEQLMKHGDALKTKVIHQSYGADPAAVAYDAIQYAKAHHIKAVLIDTAGRMHTKGNLLREMDKIVRVAKPDFKIFVGESITGNDATEQARNFNNAVGIDGIILSKQDVDERGGTAISVGYITGKPILYLGTGQNYESLEKFNKNKILVNLGLE